MSANEDYIYLSFRIPNSFYKIRNKFEEYAAKKKHLIIYYANYIVVENPIRCGKDVSWTYEYEKLLEGVDLYMSTDRELSLPSD